MEPRAAFERSRVSKPFVVYGTSGGSGAFSVWVGTTEPGQHGRG